MAKENKIDLSNGLELIMKVQRGDATILSR
jgi:hypothetical protein